MIKTELLENNMARTYSDAGFLIHGGNPESDYTEAVDPVSAGRTYTETDIPIPQDEDMPDDEATIEDYQAALEQLGVSLEGSDA